MSNAVWCCGAQCMRSIPNMCILPNNFSPASLHGRASACAISIVMHADDRIVVVSHREHGGHRGFWGCVVVDLCEMRLVLHSASRSSPQCYCMDALASVQSLPGSFIPSPSRSVRNILITLWPGAMCCPDSAICCFHWTKSNLWTWVTCT